MRVLSVDPAKRDIWWAEWKVKELVNLGRQTFEFHNEILLPIHNHVVIEEPQVYHGAANTKGADAEDLLQVMKTVGAVLHEACGFPKVYKPNEWKGQVPKDIMAARIKKRLSIQELATVEAYLRSVSKSLHHNVWDAIGIGLYYHGRL